MKRQFPRRALTAADGEYILWHVLAWLRSNHEGGEDFCPECKATETVVSLIQTVQREQNV